MMAPREGERLKSTVTLSNPHGQPHYSPDVLVGDPSLELTALRLPASRRWPPALGADLPRLPAGKRASLDDRRQAAQGRPPVADV
jgi:hypothetical protein